MSLIVSIYVRLLATFLQLVTLVAIVVDRLLSKYKNFILPKPASPTLAELKVSHPEGYVRVSDFLESLVDVAQAMTQIEDREPLRRNLIASLDAGISAFTIDQEGLVYVVMWHFDKGEYFPMTSKHFDTYDYATLLRMSDILTKLN